MWWRVASRRRLGIVDFAALPPLPPVDEVYLALCTTIKVAGSSRHFGRSISMPTSRWRVQLSPKVPGDVGWWLVSAMGVNAKSTVFYNSVKGELEDALAQLAFEGPVIAQRRPRSARTASMVVRRILGPLILANYRPISAAKVASALLARTPAAQGRVVH